MRMAGQRIHRPIHGRCQDPAKAGIKTEEPGASNGDRKNRAQRGLHFRSRNRRLVAAELQRFTRCSPGLSAFEPVTQLAFTRQAGVALDQVTPIEVRFEPVGCETHVTAEHRGWESLPQDHIARMVSDTVFSQPIANIDKRSGLASSGGAWCRHTYCPLAQLAGGLGFEPRLAESESAAWL